MTRYGRMRGSMSANCWRVSHRAMGNVNMPKGVMMKMRHMDASKAPSPKHERKEAEAEADRETDKVKV